MKITNHAIERFKERATIDFAYGSDKFLITQIVSDIKKNIKTIRYNKKGGFMVEGKYCKYIFQLDVLVTVFIKKKFLSGKEKKYFKDLYKDDGVHFVTLYGNNKANIINILNINEIEYVG